MADLGTGADALRVMYSGASVADGRQSDPDACLGGYPSSMRLRCLDADRDGGIPGVRVDFVSGWSGAGWGSLRALGADELAWTPPGGAEGAGVTIAQGESKILGDADGDKFLGLTRVGGMALGGSEEMTLEQRFNNLWDNVTAAEQAAGDIEYRAVMLQNGGATAITGLKVWIGDASQVPGVRIALEVPSGGSVQTVANEGAAPAGVSWNAGTTSGTGLSHATLAAGDFVGLWIERDIPVDEAATASAEVTVHLEFTFGGSTFNESLCLPYRIADDRVAGYETYIGVDAPPNFGAAAAFTFAALPHTEGIALAEGVNRIVTRERNAYGVLGLNAIESTIVILSGGSEDVVRPSAPTAVEVSQIAGDLISIQAFYNPGQDAEAVRADSFAIWISATGSAPDPEVDTPVVEAMVAAGGLEVLVKEIANTYLDATPLKVLVRTRNGGTPDVDSSNTDVVSMTVVNLPPAAPDIEVSFGLAWAQEMPNDVSPPSIPADDFVVDAVNDIRFEGTAGRVSLYAGTELIWCAIYDSATGVKDFYIPLGWTISGKQAPTGAGSSEPVEVISWTGGDKRLHVNVNGSAVMLIDVTNKVVGFTRRVWGKAFEAVGAPEFVWPRFADTYFQVFDPGIQDWVSYMRLDGDGLWRSNTRHIRSKTQGEIEAL